MDWKYGYGDGALDRWRVADVDEFLFDWCPRKLSAAPEDCAGIPTAVTAFVEFAHRDARRGRSADPDPRALRTQPVPIRHGDSRQSPRPRARPWCSTAA